MSDGDKPDALVFRVPNKADAVAMWQFTQTPGGLEANSAYAYLLLADHFRDTCMVAELDGRIVGFVAGYRPPTHPDAYFVWQVGVHPDGRGRGIASRMLDAVVDRQTTPVRFLEATVTPSNDASRRLFRSFAERRGVECVIASGFEPGDFPDGHEAEELFRIGPLQA